ncbi:hypothetical protein Ntsu_65750 [Nocardia sp. IFM 10818]
MIRSTVDLNAVYARVRARHRKWERERIKRPLIRIFDGDMRLFGEVVGELSHGFEFIENESGTGHIKLPLDHYVAKWIADHRGREKRNVIIAFDKQGARWTGTMKKFNVRKQRDGSRYLEAVFIHDLEHLRHIRVFPNPWLPPEVQFPKTWLLAGPSKWVVSMTLLAQLMRKEMSWWQLPDDPMDFGQWVRFDIAQWSMVVAPSPFLGDTSVWTVVYSRFKSFYDTVKKTLDDGQISIDARRWFPEDGPPWPGQNSLKPGALVFRVLDKSAWNTGTSFEGNLLSGFQHMFTHFDETGLVEGRDVIPNPNVPEYSDPNFKGTVPAAPWVIFEESKYTGIETSDWEYIEATDVQAITGGHSAPYVNETIGAAVIGIAGFIGSLVGQSQVGPAVNEMLKPLYTDVFAAFMAHRDRKRLDDLGWTAFYEGFAQGSDKAYTLAAIISLRKFFWDTRRKVSMTVKIADAMPYRIGAPGFGDFWLGDRVGISALGMPKHLVYVEQVKKISYTYDTNGPSGWQLEIGSPEPADPLLSLYGLVRELGAGLQEMGVV